MEKLDAFQTKVFSYNQKNTTRFSPQWQRHADSQPRHHDAVFCCCLLWLRVLTLLPSHHPPFPTRHSPTSFISIRATTLFDSVWMLAFCCTTKIIAAASLCECVNEGKKNNTHLTPLSPLPSHLLAWMSVFSSIERFRRTCRSLPATRVRPPSPDNLTARGRKVGKFWFFFQF